MAHLPIDTRASACAAVIVHGGPAASSSMLSGATHRSPSPSSPGRLAVCAKPALLGIGRDFRYGINKYWGGAIHDLMTVVARHTIARRPEQIGSDGLSNGGFRPRGHRHTTASRPPSLAPASPNCAASPDRRHPPSSRLSLATTVRRTPGQVHFADHVRQQREDPYVLEPG